MKSHVFSVHGKILSSNAEHKLTVFPRSEAIRQWRQDAFWEAKRAGLPHVDRCSVIVQPYQHRGVLMDAGNAWPTAKAVIDGCVDAGVLTGDDPSHVSSVTLLAPRRVEGSGVDWVAVELIEVPSAS
jgi:hypothetical protein